VQFALPSISETGPLANKSIKAMGKSPAVMHNPFAPAPYFNVGKE